MRRVLKGVAGGVALGDTSTPADPSVVGDLKEARGQSWLSGRRELESGGTATPPVSLPQLGGEYRRYAPRGHPGLLSRCSKCAAWFVVPLLCGLTNSSHSQQRKGGYGLRCLLASSRRYSASSTPISSP
jgi:hypothetical protein